MSDRRYELARAIRDLHWEMQILVRELLREEKRAARQSQIRIYSPEAGSEEVERGEG
jgi:hypothetical protein